MRRRLLLSAGSAALAARAAAMDFAAPPAPARVRASEDRIVDVTVGIRPFRLQGPRIEAERIHGKPVVHHYGHGGSGWSLSWGSAQVALPLIQATGARHVAVIGCGAIGLTTARVAQLAGLQVRIYAKARPPWVHSSAATGLWTPDSRICAEAHATPAWTQRWEAMARASFTQHRSLLGLGPVEWHDGYLLSDQPFDQAAGHPPGAAREPDYPDLAPRIADLRPASAPLRPEEHPFRVAHARRFTQVVFNIRAYQRLLLEDFYREGGQVVRREFRSAREWAGLPEGVVVNCTGIAARQLVGDTGLVPVRGQVARLIPQPEVDYALIYRGHNLVMVPRREGLLVQAQAETDFGNTDERPDRALSDAAVRELAALYRAG
jgi:glycine/D-amino acid oxidase-like deaminating enzyme